MKNTKTKITFIPATLTTFPLALEKPQDKKQ